MADRDANQPRFTISLPNMEVLSFSGSEGLSDLFAFEVELVTKSPEVSFDAVVGQQVVLTIEGRGGTKRFLNGIVTRLDLLGVRQREQTKDELYTYRASISPPHFKLTLKRRLRIFQNKTTKEIVELVLGEGGVSPLTWKIDADAYKKRNYCVQYRETDWELVSRLLEEEGIAYYFVHAAGSLTTVFTDNTAGCEPIAGDPQLIFNPGQALARPEEFVHSFTFGQQLRSGKVQLRDYNFKVPMPVKSEASAKRDTTLEVYEYPGEFVEQGLADRLANVRLQELQTEAKVGVGGGDSIRFLPGHKFTLGKLLDLHPRKDLNREYLLTRVSHGGSQPQVLGEEGGHEPTTYGNSFAVIPSDVSFRPPRVTPRPMVSGTHTATVVGPKGEEIYVDKHGRVKVRFHWDRDRKSTFWVRVSQESAGHGFGAITIPRVGQEVLVSFLEGDPDRPIITGRVYNGKATLAYNLPKDKTRTSIKSNSSAGNPTPEGAPDEKLEDEGKGSDAYNEIRFEDKTGQEELYIQAQRDYKILVKRDRISTIKRDRKETVERNQEVHVTNDSTLTATTVLIDAKTKITLKVGGSKIEMTPTSIEISAPNITSTASVLHTIKGALVKIN